MYRVNLRALVSDSYLESLFRMGLSDTKIAEVLTSIYGEKFLRQNVTYWRKCMTTSVTATNREIKDNMIIRHPSEQDFLGSGDINTEKEWNLIFVVPDLHIPYHHPQAMDFIKAVIYYYTEMYGDDYLVVNLGDEADNHALSFHDSDPNLDSAGPELYKTREALQELVKIIPKQLICHSNHGSLHYRRAKAHGIPVEFLRTYREVLFPEGGGECWSWEYSHLINTKFGRVLFKHQTAGDVLRAAAHEGANLVVGHNHSLFEVKYGASVDKLYYGCTSGCLLDRSSMAFAYGKDMPKKPILGMTVLLDGVPQLVPMILDSDGNWVGRI